MSTTSRHDGDRNNRDGMSEVRGSVYDLIVKTAENEGRKTAKVELFPAWSFRD